MMRPIIIAALAVVVLATVGAPDAAKADSCDGALDMAKGTQARLNADAKHIFQRRAEALAMFNAEVAKGGDLTWEQLHARHVVVLLALKEIDDSFRAYIRLAQARVDMWQGLTEACRR